MKISLCHVTKRFGPTAVIDDVSLELHGGRVYGFQGINGSGKTMLMRLIAGLIYPSEGTVTVNGTVLSGENSFPESMGLLIESPSFLGGYTGLRNLELLAGIRKQIGKKEVEAAIERVGLDPADPKK